eukprot:12399283-Karenia_brevis.AAC.1
MEMNVLDYSATIPGISPASAKTKKGISLAILFQWSSLRVLWQERAQQAKCQTWEHQFGKFSGGVAPVPTFARLCEVSGAGFAPSGAVESPSQRLTLEEMVVYAFSRMADHRGTDIRINTGMPYAAHQFGRVTIDPSVWKWK